MAQSLPIKPSSTGAGGTTMITSRVESVSRSARSLHPRPAAITRPHTQCAGGRAQPRHGPGWWMAARTRQDAVSGDDRVRSRTETGIGTDPRQWGPRLRRKTRPQLYRRPGVFAPRPLPGTLGMNARNPDHESAYLLVHARNWRRAPPSRPLDVRRDRPSTLAGLHCGGIRVWCRRAEPSLADLAEDEEDGGCSAGGKPRLAWFSKAPCGRAFRVHGARWRPWPVAVGRRREPTRGPVSASEGRRWRQSRSRFCRGGAGEGR